MSTTNEPVRYPAALALSLLASTLGVMGGAIIVPVLELIRVDLGVSGTAATPERARCVHRRRHDRAHPGVGRGSRATSPTPPRTCSRRPASGSGAAGAINPDLIAKDTRHAVQTRNDPFPAEPQARLCEQVIGDRRHGL